MDEQTLNFIKQMVMRGMLLADQSRAVAHDRALPRGQYREVPTNYTPEMKYSAVVNHLKSRYRLTDEQAQQGAHNIMAGTDPYSRETRGASYRARGMSPTQFQYVPDIGERSNTVLGSTPGQMAERPNSWEIK